MNGPNADAIRRLVVEAAEKYGSMRPVPEPLTPQEQRERRLADTLLAKMTKPEEVA